MNIQLSGMLYSASVYLVFGNAVVNPFFYSVQYAPFQNQVRKLFFSREKDTASVSTISSSTESCHPRI